MRCPEISAFTDEDSRTILRDQKSEPYEYFEPGGPAVTFKIDGIPMACIGLEPFEDGNYGWMVISTQAYKYPRVFWAIRELVDFECRRSGKTYIDIRDDWEEAIRFGKWLGFTDTSMKWHRGEVAYGIYKRE